ncbi:MAG TPA: hypothetical protein VK608_13060 [Edaphobacter sp.]|nr:hypothetical protein [Edaphobacter sp.]
MNPTNQYFWAQALQSALNGINSSSLIGVLSGVGYAILLLSFLWGVYESFLHGGDVRGFAVSLLKYGVTTLVIQHWSQVFQDAVDGFGSIAATIIQNSVNQDLANSWTQQLQNYYSTQSSTGLSNGLQAVWNMDGAVGTALINLLLTIVAVAIWPLCVEVFALVYSLWGCVLYCIGPLVLGLMPSMGFSRITKGYIQNLIIWNMWAVLIAILWAMLWAMNLTSVSTLLNTDGLLGYLQGINATLLVSISTLLLSICTLLVPFVARHILHGEFGPVGMAATLLAQRASRVLAGLLSGGSGSAAAAAGGSSSMGGMSSGGYVAGLVPSGSGGFAGGTFSMDGGPQLSGGSPGSGRFSLPPTETPPPDIGTRHFPRNGGPLLLPPPSTV